MVKVVIVVPTLPCADPAAPLIVPFRMLVMSDIVVFKVVLSHAVSCRGMMTEKYIRDGKLILEILVIYTGRFC